MLIFRLDVSLIFLPVALLRTQKLPHFKPKSLALNTKFYFFSVTKANDPNLYMAFINESHIEEADIQLFKNLGYKYLNAWEKQLVGRDNLKDVVLKDRLRAQLIQLNADIPTTAIEQAIQELCRSRATLTPTMANQQVYQLIRKGVLVKFKDATGTEVQDYVRVLDFDQPQRNEFLVVAQLSIEYLQSSNITRRPDLLLYVNGLPLIMVELKNASVKVKQGYDKNLKDYRRDIPQLFWYNLLVCVSNGIQTRIGAFNAPWEHFFAWAKLKDNVNDHRQTSLHALEAQSEQTQKKLSLERFCEGLCQKAPLLDYFENFVLYHKRTIKIIAKNHQFLGVNNAIESLNNRQDKKGKLGVFWHTQGSGKSYSMIFFTRKVRRKVTGNWSFLIITDRKDLDEQIFRNFKDTETILVNDKLKKSHYRPTSRDQLQAYLQSDRSYVFSLIHKFGVPKGKTFPKLTDRNDWVVIIDEAHRTQYKSLAENMRIALPNAQYLAFTGTPLLKNELTKDWFGPYISEYNFAQSIEDGATVPLFYKKSVPKVDQINEDLMEDAAEIVADENLTEEQQRKLDREYTSLLQVVKRSDRLKEIARHIVQHYPYRLDIANDEGQRKPMKAMVVCIDKFTAVRMHDLVQEAQKEEIKNLRKKQKRAIDAETKARYRSAIDFMEETKMAVVISQEGSPQEEQEKFDKEGLSITQHRKLMDRPDDDGRDIEDYFKDPNNTYRIVFVTAMWLTGFDAPSVSTLYLDKPMQNHTLMQTIARANRVFEGKKNGLVVDYFGVFRNLRKALADYAEGSKGEDNSGKGEWPVREFEELLELLKEAIQEAKAYCAHLGADMEAILAIDEKALQQGFAGVALFDDYADVLLAKDDYRKQLALYVNTINGLYDSAKPEIYEYPGIKKQRDALEYLRRVVERKLENDSALDKARKKLDDLLDTSVEAEEIQGFQDSSNHRYVMNTSKQIDLSKLDFALLRTEFAAKKHKNIQFADLRELLEIKLRQMLAMNKTRGNLLERFEQIIEDYNLGNLDIDDVYEAFTKFGEDLSEEQQRAAREGLTEAELEVYDLLKKEALTKEEQKAVKKAATQLLQKLFDAKQKILIQEWHKEKVSQEKVRHEIKTVLNDNLPDSYGRQIFTEKIEVVYQHFYELAEQGLGTAA